MRKLSTVMRKPVVRGLISSLLISVVLLILFSVLTEFSDLSEITLARCVYGSNMASTCLGAFLAARRAGNRGWYYGALTAVLFGCVLIVLGLFGGHFVFNSTTLLQFLLMAGVGAFGGMIGVNTVRGK